MVVTAELNDYVQKARQTGMSDIAIREELLKIGWSTADVDVVVPPPIPTPPQPVLQNPFQGVPASQAKLPAQAVPQGQTPPPIHHSRVPFIVTIILLLLIGSAIYYFLPQIVTMYDQFTGQKVSSPITQGVTGNSNTTTFPPGEETVIQPSATSTASWPVYSNTTYGFEMQYPESWRLSERGKESAIFQTDGSGVLSVQVVPGKILPAKNVSNAAAFYTQKGDTIFLSDEFYTTSSSTTSNLKPLDLSIFNTIVSTFKFLPQATPSTPTKPF